MRQVGHTQKRSRVAARSTCARYDLLSALSSTGTSANGGVMITSTSIVRGGAERLAYRFEVQLQNGRIARLTLTPVLTDPQTAAYLGTGQPASVAPRFAPPATGDGGLRQCPELKSGVTKLANAE